MTRTAATQRLRATTAALIAVLWLVANSVPVTAADGGPRLDAALFAKIDTFLASEREASDIPGLAVVIVAGDQIVHTGALGVADGSGRPVTPDTPFVLASVSKALTATAVMQLVEAGAIDLDAPVQRYAPWFRVADGAASGRITIAQLLHHTSGIPASSASNDDQDEGALERRVRALASERLLFDPGTGYEYTNAGYDVLGFVVQSVSGLPFDRYVEEHIFSPLGMVHSHALARDAFADGASEAFFRWFGVATMPTRVPHPRAEGPAAMMFSSANDMGRWIIANLNGGRVGRARTRADRAVAERATDREVGVVAAVVAAGSEKAAAHELGLSHSTVKHHLANARSKVGAETTAQLVWILAPRLPEPDGLDQTDE